MYFKKLFILLLLSSSLGHSYAQEIPKKLKTLTDSIIKIQVVSFDQQGEYFASPGTGFLIKDEKGQLRVLTNFHVIDTTRTTEVIYAKSNGNTFFLIPDAFSPSHDVAFLKVEGDQKYLGKPLELRKQPLEQGEYLYALGFIDQ